VICQKKVSLSGNLKSTWNQFENITQFRASNPMDCLCIWQVINIADYDICFCRLMSHFADVNVQPSVSMLALYDVLHCCCYWTNVFSLLCLMYVSSCALWVKNYTTNCLSEHVKYWLIFRITFRWICLVHCSENLGIKCSLRTEPTLVYS